MKKAHVLVLAAVFLAGCAGTQMHYRMLQGQGVIRVDPGRPPAYDYVVSIRNSKDIGFNPDRKATRDRAALDMLETQCPQGRVVGETVIDTGKYLLGNASRTYAVQVECP